MRPILPDIHTLEQHLVQLQRDPESYRPECCPNCGKSGLWCHGGYPRKADRDGGQLNPVTIPRFRCPHCACTCSVLPECIPPRRWYLWVVQELALLGLLTVQALKQLAQRLSPARSTLRRWWCHWQTRFEQQSFHLRNRWPELGRHHGFAAFWSALLARMRLSTPMRLLNQAGVRIP